MDLLASAWGSLMYSKRTVAMHTATSSEEATAMMGLRPRASERDTEAPRETRPSVVSINPRGRHRWRGLDERERLVRGEKRTQTPVRNTEKERIKIRANETSFSPFAEVVLVVDDAAAGRAGLEDLSGCGVAAPAGCEAGQVEGGVAGGVHGLEVAAAGYEKI